MAHSTKKSNAAELSLSTSAANGRKEREVKEKEKIYFKDKRDMEKKLGDAIAETRESRNAWPKAFAMAGALLVGLVYL